MRGKKKKSASKLRKTGSGMDVVDVLVIAWMAVFALWLIVVGIHLYLEFCC